MRDISFRAYNTRTKTYCGITFSIYKVNTIDIDDAYDWIFLQYTGLKDKDDVRIYEGDIVKVIKEYGKCEEDRLPLTTCVAVMHGWGSYFEWDDKSGKTDGGGIGMDSAYPAGLEVIGNIYENSELLD